MKPALLIVDVQQALCVGPWAAFGVEAMIERINIASTRMRSAGAPVVLIQHQENDGPLQADTAAWQLDERLVTRPEDIRVRKSTCDAFNGTGLQAYLQSLAIDRVVVCGLQSEFCIDSTVRAALAHGYPVTLLADAHSTLDNGVLSAAQISAHHNATLAHLDSFGPKVTLAAAAEAI